jgi:hypothetical protein
MHSAQGIRLLPKSTIIREWEKGTGTQPRIFSYIENEFTRPATSRQG